MERIYIRFRRQAIIFNDCIADIHRTREYQYPVKMTKCKIGFIKYPWDIDPATKENKKWFILFDNILLIFYNTETNL